MPCTHIVWQGPHRKLDGCATVTTTNSAHKVQLYCCRCSLHATVAAGQLHCSTPLWQLPVHAVVAHSPDDVTQGAAWA
jgi:hypothetical protein